MMTDGKTSTWKADEACIPVLCIYDDATNGAWETG